MTTGTTTRIGLTTWSSGDDPFGRAQLQQDNLSLDNLVAIFRSGITASIPVATEAAHAKTFWYDTTTGVLSYNDGTAWRTLDDKAISADSYTVVAGSVTTPHGSSTRVARADHKHAITTGSASSITGTSSEGASASLARADHNHALGNGVIGATQIAAAVVGKAKLATDIVYATGALTFTNGNGLSVNIGATIDLSANALIVKTNAIDPTHLTTAVAGDGLDGGDGDALSVNVDNSTVEINADALRVKDTGVGKAKLNFDVVKTNGGLTFLNADGLSVNTDATTVELSSGSLRVKDAGIGRAKFNADVVKTNGGLSFAVTAGATGGLSVNTSTTIGLLSGTLIVNTNTIDPTHLTTSVAGNGITGGNGTALAALADPNGVTTGLASISVGVGGIKVNGGIVLTSAGAPSTTPPNGNMNVDTTNHILYYRSGSAWKNALWAAGTANSAPSAKGVWISAGTTPTTQGAIGDIWITY